MQMANESWLMSSMAANQPASLYCNGWLKAENNVINLFTSSGNQWLLFNVTAKSNGS